ncbi:hypothetical protein G3I13_14150 [Streptomyces sp. SID6673]|nr:hypothetical protein [Streptomyces sp. SID11726]NEB25482.1 hypothetical protein [Streptomyces sp. SID6673]
MSPAVNLLLISHLHAPPVAVAALIATLVNTPLMVYLVLPRLTACSVDG